MNTRRTTAVAHAHVAGRVVAALVAMALPMGTLLATLGHHAPEGAAGSTVDFGRHVFVAEGCVHCHSQYVRPDSSDADYWGAPRDPGFSLRQQPVLIGNRRQGPDLMNVGLRRPREWQRRHLINPRSVVPASRMPGYAHLFEEEAAAPGRGRGEALLDYLDSLGREPESAVETRDCDVAGVSGAAHDVPQVR